MSKQFDTHFKQMQQQQQIQVAENNSSLTEVTGDFSRSYVLEMNLFITRFNYIPNYIVEPNINCSKALDWLVEKYNNEVIDVNYNKIIHRNAKDAALDDVFIYLYEDLMVNFDTQQSKVRYLFKKTPVEKVETILQAIKKFKKRKSKHVPRISIITNPGGGLSTTSFELKKPKLNITDNYNDDFKEVHQIIAKRLSTKDDKGLVLLHGKPGTGKTSYLRFLAATLKKEIIFLPPNMATVMTSPDLMGLLIDNANSIFVIEDAEKIIIDRERNGHSPVSALLNITDGLLSDCLNIQVICSFNTDISKVDEALLRKGRLIAKYEFKELEVAKAQALSNKLGFKTIIETPMKLTNIYNQNEQEFVASPARKTIGFLANKN